MKPQNVGALVGLVMAAMASSTNPPSSIVSSIVTSTSFFLAAFGNTASSFAFLPMIGAIILASPPAQAIDLINNIDPIKIDPVNYNVVNYNVDPCLGGVKDCKVYSAHASTGTEPFALQGAVSAMQIGKNMPAELSARIGATLTGEKGTLSGNVIKSFVPEGSTTSFGAQGSVPLNAKGASFDVGASANTFSSRGGGQAHYNRASVGLGFGNGLNAHVGAVFPRNGPAQPFVGLQYGRNF